jgi:hypothetical protein
MQIMKVTKLKGYKIKLYTDEKYSWLNLFQELYLHLFACHPPYISTLQTSSECRTWRL